MAAIKIVESSIDRHEAIYRLVEDHGVRQIGKGVFGSVLAAPNSRTVFKICRDSAYLAFITAILEFQDNPWFPKVVSASLHYPDDEPWYFIVQMERLRKGSEGELRAALLLLDTNLVDILLIGAVMHVPPRRMKKLAEMQRLLRRLFRKYGPDFHKGNIMFRKNHPVIIDPIVSPEDLTLSKI